MLTHTDKIKLKITGRTLNVIATLMRGLNFIGDRVASSLEATLKKDELYSNIFKQLENDVEKHLNKIGIGKIDPELNKVICDVCGERILSNDSGCSALIGEGNKSKFLHIHTKCKKELEKEEVARKLLNDQLNS